MKISKKLEKEIRQIMDDYWNSYFEGDLQKWASYLPDHYRNIGSTEVEIWNSKKEIVDFTNRVFDQTVGKAELRDKITQIFSYDPYIMVHELGDLYVNVGEGWIFYAKFRLSSLMEETSDGWKILHQHGSYPDSKTEKGEAFAFDEIKAENKKLKDVIESRTKELEIKNRELEIEASLERVRAVAMSMNSPSELQKVGEVIFHELHSLRFNALRNTEIIINKFENQSILSYYYSDYGVSGKIEVDYTSHPKLKKWTEDLKTAGDGFAAVHISEGEMHEWRKYREELGYLPDPKLEEVKTLDYYSYSTGLGALSISSFEPIDDQELLTLERFRNVFSLAYKKYNDVVKAEGRAWEAQIEVSLERVRARTMAMHKSDELLDNGEILFSELSRLGVEKLTCGFVLMDNEQKIGWNYGVNPGDGSVRPLPTGVPQAGTKVLDAITKSWKKQEPYLVIKLDEAETISHQSYMAENSPNFSLTKEQLLALSPDRLIIHTFNFKYGYLLLVGGTMITADQQEMIGRFAQVFEQTYRRFLDLQKAEAQARKAQIEVALEKVRSRSLGMHKSHELEAVIKVLFQQFQELGMHVQHTGFLMDYKDRDDMFIWLADENVITPNITIPYFDSPHWNSFLEAKKKNQQLFTNHLDFETKNNFYKKLFEYAPGITEEEKSFYLDCEGLAISTVLMDNVGLYIENFSGIPYSDAENEILLRFGHVFQQSYTRFLDLQKAEAQAREARIESALERVRSRSLAMHNSDELGEVITKVVEQLRLFDISTEDGVALITHIEDSKDLIEWMENPGFPSAIKFHLPYFNHPVLTDLWKAKEEGADYLTTRYTAKESRSFLHQIFEKSDFRYTPKEVKDYCLAAETYGYTIAYQKNTAIFINDYSDKPLSNNDILVLKRFSRVFEQAYTRFLDLLKAEKRARDAQIEAAVEKVRGKALGMHNSSQIMEVVSSLKDEMMGLNIAGVAAATIYLKDEDGYIRMWDLSSVQQTEEGFQVTLDVKFKLEDIHSDLYIRRIWGNDNFYFVEKQDKKDMVITLEWLRQYHPEQADETEKFLKNNPLEYLFHPTIQLENGKMSVDILNEEPPAEMPSIMRKMGAAFDLAYKRFQDLQKKEVQLKESRVELSLEKIRAQVTAMQESADLFDIVVAMRKEFISLGHEADSFWHMRWSQENYEMSMTSEDGNRLGMVITVPKFVHEQDKSLYEWEISDRPYYVMDLDAKGAWDYIDKMNTYGHYKHVDLNAPTEEDIHSIGGLTFILARTTHGEIGYSLPGKVPRPPQESIDTLVRFAGVFDLAYRRFEDIKEAERQKREAEIELALERVRARSMAMHHTSEIQSVISTVHKELLNLDISINGGSFIVINDDIDNELYCWGAGGTANTSELVHVPHFGMPFCTNLIKGIKKGPGFFTETFSQKEKKAYFNKLFKQPPWSELDVKKKNETIESDGGYTRSCCVSDHTSIFIINHFGRKFSEDENNILKRLSKVFEQSYTRFLDLQKAEAQTREAQIEAALERTRTQSMLMQHTDGLSDVSNVFHEQLLLLGVPSEFSYVWLPDEKSMTHMFWATWSEKNNGIETSHNNAFTYPLDKSEPYTAACFKMWESEESVFVNRIPPEDVKDFFSTWSELLSEAKTLKAEMFPDGLYYAEAYMKYGCFGINVRRSLNKEEQQILMRFSIEFERAYTRFLDLQKAEAQARDAQIEAALEKVRSRTMAMHKSSELSETAILLFEQIELLGIETFASGFNIWDDAHENIISWMSNATGTIQPPFVLPIHTYDQHKEIYNAWKEKEVFLVHDIKEDALEKHYHFLRSFSLLDESFRNAEAAGIKIPDRQVHNIATFSHGYLLFITMEPTPELQDIFVRFAKVFEQTYTRFLDLQKSEAQARDSQIEAALEKVRSQTMSMHSPDELEDVVAIIAEKLKELGVILDANGVILCTYFKESKDVMHWIAAPDFSGSGRYLLPYFDHPIFSEVWESKLKGDEYYSNSYSKEDKNSFYEYAFEHSDYKHFPEEFKEWVFQNDKHSLSFAWQKNSAILIPSHTGVVPSESEKEILKRFAKVFEQAYVRFMDLQTKEEQSAKIAEEKQRLEKTLKHLQETQAQLIQSEKMASLGELTAGIAHEIQNPLNFVNNFSEVSNEMIDELKEEIANKDYDEVGAIAEDLKQNMEKIHHHGRRAESIVKGMLMHSRSGKGEKIPTDINALCDEFLRLSYHGLRAKDRTFNAEFVMEFDKTIPKIEVVPQDMGRVLFNLFNNAFQACVEKPLTQLEERVDGIESSRKEEENKISGIALSGVVKVQTKNLGEKIEITVSDNGHGIPDNIKDKIFQPFFTTKPTGQGTGLGLSLAYDIVKAHGGILEVESEEGRGCIFFITIPIK